MEIINYNITANIYILFINNSLFQYEPGTFSNTDKILYMTQNKLLIENMQF